MFGRFCSNIFQVASLFEDHADLLEEFTRFLPDTSATSLSHNIPFVRNSTQRGNERSAGIPPLRQMQMDKVFALAPIFFSFLGFTISFLFGIVCVSSSFF